MKILLDENIDVRFKKIFEQTAHEVYTVRDMQWIGVKNGELLKLLKAHGFDCWVVVDKNLRYQQNTANLPCVILVLDVVRNTLKHISPLLPSILAALEQTREKKFIVITE